MTGFKFASMWSSKSDQHVKEDSYINATEKTKKKKSFFGFVKSKKSKKAVEKPLSEEPTSNVTFTSNPLKTSTDSPAAPPSPVKTFNSFRIVSNTEKSFNSGTLPNGRLNPLSLLHRKKTISSDFSPSKTNTQSAVLDTVPQQTAKNRSFDHFIKEYEKDWAGSYPEHKESSNHSDDDEEEDDDAVPLYGGRFFFTNENESSNVSSRVVSLSVQPEVLQTLSRDSQLINNEIFDNPTPANSVVSPNPESTIADHINAENSRPKLEPVTEQHLNNIPEVEIFGNTSLVIENPSDACIEIEEKKVTENRPCFTQDSTDNSSVNDSSNKPSRVVSLSIQPDAFSTLFASQPVEDVQVDKHESTSDQDSKASTSSALEQSVSIATAVENATQELSQPENSREVDCNLNVNDSTEQLPLENITLESKVDTVSHIVISTHMDTNNTTEIISKYDDTKFIDLQYGIIAEANEDVLNELYDKQSIRNISNEFHVTDLKDEMKEETNSESLDLHCNGLENVEKCQNCTVMVSSSVENTDKAAATHILPTTTTVAEITIDDTPGCIAESGEDITNKNNEENKATEVYMNSDSAKSDARSGSSYTHCDSSTSNIIVDDADDISKSQYATTGVNIEIEAPRDRTHSGMARNNSIEKSQEIELKKSDSTTADPVVSNPNVPIKKFAAMVEADSDRIQIQRLNDTTNVESNESIVLSNSNVRNNKVDVDKKFLTVAKDIEADSNMVLKQTKTSIRNDANQKVSTKASIIEKNCKVLAAVKNIEASSTGNGSGKFQKQSPTKGRGQDSQFDQITEDTKKSSDCYLISNDNDADEYSRELAVNKRRRLKSKDVINIDGKHPIPENEKITFDTIGTRSKCSLESQKVANNVETNGDFSISKPAFGSSAIPYLALREKPPPVLSRSRTRVSQDSNETKEVPIPSNKSCDATDVHVDLLNIYDEPSEEFLSSFISESSRSNTFERNDSMLTTSAESLDGYSSPKLLPFPYLSSKGLMKIDSTDVPIINSNKKPIAVSNSKSQRKHKSVDSFFGNPFDDIIDQLSYTHSAENEVLDLGYDLEISDCTEESVSQLQEVEDQCPYEYKDIMKIESVDSIDFILNPLRNPSNKSDSSDHQCCEKELSASTQEESTTQWNWRSVVAGTPSPSLSMMAPSLVKPDGRKRGSRSISHDFTSGEDSRLHMKDPACELPQLSEANDLQPEESTSSAQLANTKLACKAHRRSGDMIDMDSCLASLLQNPSSISLDTENEGYSVPSIRKVARVIRKQFQSQSIPESNSVSIESESGLPTSNQHENGQQSLQRINLKAVEVSDYRIKVAHNARTHLGMNSSLYSSTEKLSIDQPVADSSAKSVTQKSSPQKKFSGNDISTLLSPSPRKNAQNNLSVTKLLQNKLSSPSAAKSAALQTSGSKSVEPRSNTKAPKQRSKSDHAIEAVDRALRSASTTAANINRLCNVLQPQPQPQKDNQTINKARSYSPHLTTASAQSKPALVEKCTGPSVNQRLDLLMGRGSKSPEKCALNRDDLIHDAELLEKNKVTLSESLVSFDRNVVKEAQRRKLTLAAKLDLQILKEVVESVNRFNFLSAKAKKSMTSMSIEEKKELKALNNEKARHDRVHDFANSDRSSKKFTSNERIVLQPLKQELERKIKFSRLYRKHKKNEPFSFDEKAEYILLKESLEAEKRFEQLLVKFNSYADEEQRAEKLKHEVTVFERVELIILKLEQDKQQRYELLLSKEKSSLAVPNQSKLNLAERSELVIIKKEIELQYKQHQEKVALLAQQLRQGYTYSASIDPFAAAISSTRTNGETMANMVNKAYSISMDGYETNNSSNSIDLNDDANIPFDQQPRNDVNIPSLESKSRNTGTNTSTVEKKPVSYQQSVDIREEAGSNRAGKTTVITITIKDKSLKNGVNFIHDKSGGKAEVQSLPQDVSSVSRARTELDKHPTATVNDSDTMGNQSIESGHKVAKIAKIAEEKIRTYFAEKENELSREKQKKLEDFLRRSICSDSDNDDSCNDKSDAKFKSCGAVPQDKPSFSSSSGESIGISLTETYDSYSHFNITQKAELNLLKLEGEKQQKLVEEKQRKLAQFLEVVDETDNSSLNSAKSSSVGSQKNLSSRGSGGSVKHRKVNSFSSASNAGPTTYSPIQKYLKTKLEVPANKSSAVDIKSKAATHDIQGRRVSTSPPRRPTSILGLDDLTKVAAKPLRPEVLKKRLGCTSRDKTSSISCDSADKSSPELPIPTIVTPTVTINDGSSSSLSTRGGGEEEDPRKQRSVSTPTQYQRLNPSSSSSSVVSATTNDGSRPRRQPAIVQIFEQAKELHRKAEIERIENLKNDPSRKIIDPPFSLILGSSYAGQDRCDSNT